MYIWQTCQYLHHVTPIQLDQRRVFCDTRDCLFNSMAATLQAWRETWDATMRNSLSRDSSGVPVHHALPYWGVVCWLSAPKCTQVQALKGDKGAYTRDMLLIMKRLDSLRRGRVLIGVRDIFEMRNIVDERIVQTEL